MSRLLALRIFSGPIFLRSVCFGGLIHRSLVEILHEYGLLPDATEEELKLIRDNTVDFLGVNYYQPLRVMAPRFAKHPESPLLPEHFLRALCDAWT